MKKKESVLNGEHEKLYDRINESHKETIELIMKVKEDISNVKEDIAVVKSQFKGLSCTENSNRIRTNESKLYMGMGGLAVFTFISTLLTITKLLGFW